ncbi:hypothetical protein JVT61DRAFT_3700 [Boletus reticuloceps]|uniref:Uncharacterized protein n=1 Tax=Boletus reticuloceps TaxID=495285 RepID=A0A8I3A9W4_9AGAM|nr:hypothetical protein JVT61DRAFT_3700 [Boletus reticuloceps]
MLTHQPYQRDHNPRQARRIAQWPERKTIWWDREVPQLRDYLQSRIIQLSQEWKDFRGEAANKGAGDRM